MLTVSDNEFNSSLEQSITLGALDVIVIEWQCLLYFVLHMRSIVHSIVLKSVSQLSSIQSKIPNPVHQIVKKRKIWSLGLNLWSIICSNFFKILESNLETKRKCLQICTSLGKIYLDLPAYLPFSWYITETGL